MKSPLRETAVVASLMAATAMTGLLAYAPSRAGILDFIEHRKPDTVQPDMAKHPGEVPAAATALPPNRAPDYREIVRQWGPAVVGITVEGTRKSDVTDQEAPAPGGDPFLQFFRGIPGFQFRTPHAIEQPFHGQGSGFIISSDGLILTNAHVVRDAQEVTVKLADRRELKAKVLGADPATDIAVLRIDASGLPAVSIGDPRTLQVGDYVLAIGAPFGFDQSATAGIVSAKGRSLPSDSFVPFIQTDAAVNPGNSGGPLFDAAGNVIGINAQIYSQSGGYQGLSFAIPIDVALRAKSQIVATGHASHARLGVQIQDLNQALADSFGLTRPDGALISSVEPDSPAAEAGLKPGDIITQVDGASVLRGGDLANHIGMNTPGAKVTLKIWRDHSGRDVEIRLAKADPEGAVQTSEDNRTHGRLGLSLRPLTPEERRADGLDHGLVVEGASGPAALAGIQSGDLVLGIDGLPATSVDQLLRALRSHPKSVALLIARDGQRIFVPLQLG